MPTASTGGDACLAAMLDGVSQPPYHLGLAAARVGRARRLLATTCPNTLVIDKIDAPYPMAVPNKEFDLVIGEHLTHVSITVVRDCSPADALAGMLGDVTTTTTARGGELLLFGFEGKTAPPELCARIAAGRAMGVILFARNLGTPDEIAALTRALHARRRPTGRRSSSASIRRAGACSASRRR